jgi:hypothetical protein
MKSTIDCLQNEAKGFEAIQQEVITPTYAGKNIAFYDAGLL